MSFDQQPGPPPPPGSGANFWSQPSTVDPLAERAIHRSNSIWIEIVLTFFFHLYAPVLLIRALLFRRALRKGGVAVPTPITVGFWVGALGTAYMLLVFALIVLAISLSMLRPPTLWVANGRTERARLAIDGEHRGWIESDLPQRFDIDHGSHTLCMHFDLTTAPVCSTREFARRETVLWNPGSFARFTEIVTHYAEVQSADMDDEVIFVPRTEWRELRDISFYFEEPPEEIYISGTHGTRRWIMQARSDPVSLFLDNPTDSSVDVLVDDRHVETIQPRYWKQLFVREGLRHIVVRSPGAVLIDSRLELQDFGSYVLDCTPTTSDYIDNTLDGQDRVLQVHPVPPAPVHDVTEHESVFGTLTSRAEWYPPPRNHKRRFELPPAQ